jgi:hypothetical protein
MGEHNFMREQRYPFKGFVAVSVGAANEFVLAIGPAQELGRAELTNDPLVVALWNEVI